MKDTYTFETKGRARKDILKFGLSHLYKPASEAKVLTLMGHERTELETMWVPMGIQPENITVVEEDPNVHALIKKRIPEVNLIEKPVNLLEYLIQVPTQFDFMNLDTMNQFSFDERDLIRCIAYRQLLRDNGILATWFVGHREHGYASTWYKQTYRENRHLRNVEGYESKIKGRSDAISGAIVSIMIDGITNGQAHPFVNAGSRKRVYEKLLSAKPEVQKVLREGFSLDGLHSSLGLHIAQKMLRKDRKSVV